MKKIVLTFVALSVAVAAFAQIKRNSIYAEIGGNTVFYSVNYDYVFNLSTRLKVAPRAGLMYLPLSDMFRTDYGDLRIPIEVNLLWSNKESPRHFIEGGLGMSFIQIKLQRIDPQSGMATTVGNKFGNVTTVRLGYRYQKPTGGFMLRAGLLAPIAQDKFSQSSKGDDIFFTLFPGISLGHTF